MNYRISSNLHRTFLRSIGNSGNTPEFYRRITNKSKIERLKRIAQTSDDIANASAIISKPDSTLTIFLTFPNVISRLESVNTTPAGSCPSLDAGISEYCDLAFLLSPHALRNFPKTFVGGLSSSRS